VASTKEFTYFQSAFTRADSPATQAPTDSSTPVILSEGASPVPDSDISELRTIIPPPTESSLRRKLEQRQKQLDIGKNTPEYFNYRRLVPR
jgi:hypothetical protein